MCMQACLHAYIHAYKYPYICGYIHPSICAYVYTYVHRHALCMHTHAHVHKCSTLKNISQVGTSIKTFNNTKHLYCFHHKILNELLAKEC